MIRLSFIVLLVMSAVAASAADFTIGGLSLGMTPSQVQGLLAAKYKVIRASKPPSPTNPITYLMLANGKQDAFVVSFFDGKAFYIQHEMNFATGEQPTAGNALNQLLQKFGTYTEYGGYIGDPYTWQWNAADQLSRVRNRACDIDGAIATGSGYSPDFPHLSFPTRFGDCHKTVLVSLYGAANAKHTPDVLESGMDEYLEDPTLPYSFLKQKANQAAQQNDVNQQKGKTVAVPY